MGDRGGKTGDIATEAGVFKTSCACAAVRAIRRWDPYPPCPSCGKSVHWLSVSAVAPKISPLSSKSAAELVAGRVCASCGGALRATPLTPERPDYWVRVLPDGTAIAGTVGPTPTEPIASGSAFCAVCGKTVRFLFGA